MTLFYPGIFFNPLYAHWRRDANAPSRESTAIKLENSTAMARTVNKAKVERRAREARPRFEQVLTAENETFLWRIDDYPWARSVWNFHPEFEIHLIRKSIGTVFIGDYIGDSRRAI
jgi:hypothetical protein